jgi:hypothetical protein
VAGERTVASWFWNGTTYVQGSVTEAIKCDIVPKSDLPDYTLNGILPNNSAANNVVGFNGILPVLDGQLLTSDYTGNGYGDYYQWTTNGASAYALVGNGSTYDPVSYISTYNYSVKKVDLANGAVTKVGELATSTGIQQLLFYNGSLYGITNEWSSTTTGYVNTLKMYPITGTATLSLGTIPAFQYIVPSNVWPSAITATGTDIYYALNSWDTLTGSSTTEVRKLSNLTTDASLFTVSEYIGFLAFYNGNLYTDGDYSVEKRNPDGTIASAYVSGGGGWNVMAGGYFYRIADGKLVKSAGTPAGGTAKLTSLLGKFF